MADLLILSGNMVLYFVCSVIDLVVFFPFFGSLWDARVAVAGGLVSHPFLLFSSPVFSLFCFFLKEESEKRAVKKKNTKRTKIFH